jgi:hypothetical protein
MRSALKTMLAAGMKKARFSGRFAYRNARGIIALEDVSCPIGTIDHIFVRRGHWHGPIPEPGQEVTFSAYISTYSRRSGEMDYGLFSVEVI